MTTDLGPQKKHPCASLTGRNLSNCVSGDGNFVDSSRTITINLIFTGRVPRGFRRLLREVLEEADSALVAGKPPVYAHARKSKPRDRQPG